jgi:hypothetical protein
MDWYWQNYNIPCIHVTRSTEEVTKKSSTKGIKFVTLSKAYFLKEETLLNVIQLFVHDCMINFRMN